MDYIYITQIGDLYVLAYLDDNRISVTAKDIAIAINLATTKLYNKIYNLNGMRIGNSIAFIKKNDAENALNWINSMGTINKLTDIERPHYGRY